jgi:hypothetical protein
MRGFTDVKRRHFIPIWPAPSFIDTLFGAMMHNEVSYGTQAF